MIKRTLLALGLGMALLGGAATTGHAGSHVAARPAAVHADLIVSSVGAQTGDTDANAPCVAATATTPETGDCQNSQNTAGPEDNPRPPGEDRQGPDTDNVQSGPQVGDLSGQ